MICKGCELDKPENDFQLRNPRTGNRRNHCYSCLYKQVAENAVGGVDKWNAKMREQYRNKWKENILKRTKKYSQTEHGKKIKNKSSNKWKNDNPEKISAQRMIRKEISSGRLARQPCETCGEFKFLENGRTAIVAHHDDYAKPLEVRWLCLQHHNEHHAREREIQRQQQQ